jgi:hypothetical protein
LRLINVALLAAVAWGLWTTINIVRLGPRGSNPAIYWPSGILVAVISCGLAGLVARRLPRTPD